MDVEATVAAARVEAAAEECRALAHAEDAVPPFERVAVRVRSVGFETVNSSWLSP